MMGSDDRSAVLQAALDQVSDRVRAALQSDIRLLNTANESVLSHGGKRVRPRLALLCARVCSGGEMTEDTLRFATAAELLHNATLLHDDVADGSMLRRGEPTVMSLLGGRSSVLLGDYWLVKAMDEIFRADRDAWRVTRLFSSTLSDLAEGELLQLEKADTGDTVEADYFRIIRDKTASLFEATAGAAAISVAAAPDAEAAVRRYALHLGLAFQIRDDMMDYEGGDRLGKPAGQDLRERKITLPLLGALGRVDADRQAAVRRMVCDGQAAAVLAFVRENDGLGAAREVLEEEVALAVEALAGFPDSADKQDLIRLARFVADRDR